MNNQQILEANAHTPLWMPAVLVVLTMALFVIIIYMGKDIYQEQKQINIFKNNQNNG